MAELAHPLAPRPCWAQRRWAARQKVVHSAEPLALAELLAPRAVQPVSQGEAVLAPPPAPQALLLQALLLQAHLPHAQKEVPWEQS